MKFFAFILLLLAWCQPQGVWGLSKTVDTPASTETPPLCGVSHAPGWLLELLLELTLE